MEQKRGRPKSEKPKLVDVKVRLDQDTADKLDAYCKKKNIQRAKAIRMAITDMVK